nr:DUF2333 family protein [Sinobacterium caligoides]
MQDWLAESHFFGALKWLVILFLVVMLMIGWYWSREPATFTIEESLSNLSPEQQQVTGAATSGALIEVMEVVLNKPGGYLRNDRMPPGVLLDNLPSWEYGVLIQVRDLSRAMREYFSRSQSQSREDQDLIHAEPRFNFQPNSWVLPSTESEYREGVRLMQHYQQRLVDSESKDAQFYARSDNLVAWLGMVSSRLGSLSQRLSASVVKTRIDTSLQGDSEATQSTASGDMVFVKTPWTEIDNIFYEARGTSWALLHFLKAIERDFAPVLAKKNAAVSLRQIIRELEETQGAIYSPIILNGSGFGLMANHSLAMASYITRANAAIIDLQDLMNRG